MSPPIVFVAGVAGTYDGASSLCTFTTPTTAKPGDLIVMVMAFVATTTTIATIDGSSDLASKGWTQVSVVTTATRRLVLLMRTVTEDEPISHPVTFSGTPDGMGALLVLRAHHKSQAPAGLAATDIAASVNFVCPAQTLTVYSGLYVGVSMAEVTFAPGCSGTTTAVQSSSATLGIHVFFYRPEATGSTGTKTDINAAARTGVAASFHVPAEETARAGFTLPSPVGSIGLPDRGI